MSINIPLPLAGSNDQVSAIFLIPKRTTPGPSHLCCSPHFDWLYSPHCKHKSCLEFGDATAIGNLLIMAAFAGSVPHPGLSFSWPCEAKDESACAYMCVYKGKAGTVLFTEGVTDAAAYSLSLSSPLTLLPPPELEILQRLQEPTLAGNGAKVAVG